MAKEYIEREIPLRQIRAEALNLLEQEGRRTNEVLAYGHCFGIVDSVPAADVEPVRHGRWIDCSNGWMCSECEQDNTYDKPYCPNCGAKMDLKGEC